MTVAPLNKTALPPGVEFKKFSFEIKEFNEDQGIITGYLSTFDNIDQGLDRVRPSAFKKTISDALSRKSTKGKKGLWPLLWFHDPDKPIGLFIDAKEDTHGLLTTAQLDITTNAQGIPNNPLATMVFSGFKMGFIDELSIGYKAVRTSESKEVIDGKTVYVRELLEIQLFEGSAITSLFAMNQDAQVTGVKSLSIDAEYKDACGDTSLPIGPRDEAWDGAKAKKQLFSWAEKDDGSLDASKLRKVFMSVDGDLSLKGSWGLPFCFIVNGSPRICVGAVKAIAAACQGSRGASLSDADAIKSKVETLYNRINKMYPDDPQLTPPWKDDGKGRSMTASQHKDFNDRYRAQQIKSWMCDLDGWYSALRKSLFDIFLIGDTPQTDVLDTVLNNSQDNTLGAIPALEQWVQRGIDLNVSNYLQDDEDTDNLQAYMSYGYMSRSDAMDTKAGAAISAANKEKIMAQVKALQDMAAQHKDMIDMHKDMQKKAMQAATDLSALWDSEGQGPAYDNPQPLGKDTPDNDGKSRREPSDGTLTREQADTTQQTKQTQPSIIDTDELAALEAALSELRKTQLVSRYTTH